MTPGILEFWRNKNLAWEVSELKRRKPLGNMNKSAWNKILKFRASQMGYLTSIFYNHGFPPKKNIPSNSRLSVFRLSRFDPSKKWHATWQLQRLPFWKWPRVTRMQWDFWSSSSNPCPNSMVIQNQRNIHFEYLARKKHKKVCFERMGEGGLFGWFQPFFENHKVDYITFKPCRKGRL